jgi:hypothetical protein
MEAQGHISSNVTAKHVCNSQSSESDMLKVCITVSTRSCARNVAIEV